LRTIQAVILLNGGVKQGLSNKFPNGNTEFHTVIISGSASGRMWKLHTKHFLAELKLLRNASICNDFPCYTHGGGTSCSVLCRYNVYNQILKCKPFVFGTEIRGHASKFEAVDVCWVCLLLLSRVTDLSSSWLRTNLTRICMLL
jgi:hypothetical protein